MTTSQMIGAALLASPFLGMTALMVAEGGWGLAARVWGVTIAIFGVIVAGVFLLAGGR
jgi:hypothetical protein